MKKIALITLSMSGLLIADKVKDVITHCDVYIPSKISRKKGYIPYNNLKSLAEDIFFLYDGIVFVMAVGIVVRIIAELIEDKRRDPAVLVVDEKGMFVISLLSGHIGGANELTKKVSACLKSSVPVITTSGDVHNKPLLDIFLNRLGWTVENPGLFPMILSSIIHGREVLLYDPTGKVNTFLASEKNVKPIHSLAQVKKLTSLGPPAIFVSNRTDEDIHNMASLLLVRQKNIAIGIGCKRGTPYEDIETSILLFLKKNRISLLSVKRLASIDIKRDEEGIFQFSKRYDIPVTYFSKSEIENCASKYDESDTVNRLIGVKGVCEPAVLLSGAPFVLFPKMKMKGVTLAAGEEPC